MLRRTLFAGVAAACLMAASAVPAMAQTIRVMTWNAAFAEGNEWWDKITGDFEALHPGVTVEGNFVAFNQYLTSLSAMTAGDSLPDIFWGNVKTLDLGKAGIALDYKTVVDQAFLDQFFPRRCASSPMATRSMRCPATPRCSACSSTTGCSRKSASPIPRPGTS